MWERHQTAGKLASFSERVPLKSQMGLPKCLWEFQTAIRTHSFTPCWPLPPCSANSPALPGPMLTASVPWGWLSPQNSSVGGGPSAPQQGWTGAQIHLSTRIHAPTNEARPGRAVPSSGPYFQTVQEPKSGECWCYSCNFYLLKGTSTGGGKPDKQTGADAWLAYEGGKSLL